MIVGVDMMVKYRRLGRTNIEVFPIGFGGIPIQRVPVDEAVKIIKRAIELGVNFIDTARAYTDSEIKIGKALKDMNKRIYISSKSQNRTKAGILEDIQTSLKNLGVEKIDIYHIHAVNDKETLKRIFKPDGAYYGLVEAKKRGWIDYIAVSSHINDILEELIKSDKFDVVQVAYNFIETEVEERIFPLALERDIGIIAMKPMGGGSIDNPALSLKYVLQKDFLVPNPGMEKIEEVEENVKIALELSEITSQEYEEIERIRKETGKVFCRRCEYCQPCPQGVPISVIVRAKSFVKRIPKENLKNGWFYSAYQKAKNCIKCGVCLPRCPYSLPIPDLIEENLKFLDEYFAN
jgi:predicted aldo/keto reductase-like oxidoreductase